MASSSSSLTSENSDDTSVHLTENDIPGASLQGRKPEQLKNDELRFWLKCRNDPCKGLKTKAEYVKRVYEYINSGKDKQIVDPDANKVYTRRKELQGTSQVDLGASYQQKSVKFPDKWSTSLDKMPLFTKANLDRHVEKSGKNLGQKDHHSVPTSLRKAQTFLKDEYLEDIESSSDQRYFYFRSKCCHSFRKNDPPHELKVEICIITADVEAAHCSCVAGKVGYCNHVLALMLKMCKFSIYECKSTKDLKNEADEQSSQSCTSQLQKWHRKGGGGNIAPEPVMEVVVQKTKLEDAKKSNKAGGVVKALLYDPRKQTRHDENAELLLKQELKEIDPNMGLSQMVSSTPSDESTDVPTKFGKCKVGAFLSYQVSLTESNFKTYVDIESVISRDPLNTNQQSISYPRFPLRDIQEVRYPDNLSPPEQEFVKELNLEENEINKLELNTRTQSDCELWKVERKYRFTASRFHLISKRQRNHESFSKSLMYPQAPPKLYVEHGLKYEPVALQEYEKVMYHRRTPVTVLPCGIVVCKGCGVLGASPDGRVIDQGCIDKFGLVEVKCPQTKFHVTPLDAVTDPKFCLEKINDSQYQLKKNHPYYAQVQGQMACTGARWTDFIVYTRKGIYIERIQFDSVFWEDLQDKLVSYYFAHFVNLL